MYTGVATTNHLPPTNVYLPPIRATNTGSDTSAQYRVAGNLTQSRNAGPRHRAAADAEYNLISSYHRENIKNTSMILILNYVTRSI